MASASSSSARNLFSDSKRRLADRVAVNVNNASSVARQIVRGSKSNEVCILAKKNTGKLTLKPFSFFCQILMQSAKNFAYQEGLMESSLQNLKKMELVRMHMGYQFEAIEKAAEKLDNVKEQVHAMER